MKKPLIGINTDSQGRRHLLDKKYVDCIRAAGGVPIILPWFASRSEMKSFVDRLDGLLLTGGDDLHPRRWKGGRKHPKAKLVIPEKEESDLMLAREAVRRRLPTLAICLGCQVLNVALGGTVDQHIPDRKEGIIREHRKSGTRHAVEIARGSRLHDILGATKVRVNSFHHQANEKPGRGLRVTALAPDGVVEGIEGVNKHFLVGVQWHPEKMNDRKQPRLFRAFVAECR